MPDPASHDPQPSSESSVISRELQVRIASGAAAGIIALLMVYWGSVPFAVLVFLIGAVMSWEWGGIVRGQGFDTAGWLHILSIAAAAVLANLGLAGLGLASVAIGAITVGAILFGGGRAQLSSLGVLYTGLPLVALGWLRGDERLGFLAVLFILMTVAATDTAAYFSGRLVGGPKLWPRISPKKTWSGLAGGVAAAGLTGALFARISGSGSMVWLTLLGIVLAIVAQGGDLGESALKRHFGLKDASDLLPGHGGFMDRMDGIVTASLAAALLALIIDPYAPARAVLYGE
jgi:phosphatidate cytidylyltransferase